jgi:hypothetical protein
MVTQPSHDQPKAEASGGDGVLIGLIHPHEIPRLGLEKVLGQLIPAARIMTFSSPREIL